jgi:hypothetical protein
VIPGVLVPFFFKKETGKHFDFLVILEIKILLEL